MHIVLVRAVISGFGFTLGAALFRKVSKQLGLEDPLWVGVSVPPTQPAPPAQPPDGEPATS